MLLRLISPCLKAGALRRFFGKITSLQEIVYVYQDQPHITHIFRQGNQWIIRDYDPVSNVFELPSIDCKLSFSEIYDGVEFTAMPDEDDTGKDES